MINEDMLAAINKTAQEMEIPVKVVRKIYEEQIHYLEFMMSQFSVFDKSSQMTFKVPYICNFYLRVFKIYNKVQQYNTSKNIEHFKLNEISRIDKLFKSHPKHVKFIKSLRRKRETQWGFTPDSFLQRIVEKRRRQREGDCS